MIGLDHVPMDVRGQQGQYRQDFSDAKLNEGTDAAGMPHTSTVRRRREFENYVYVKGREIDEQRLSWRYYHIDQWTVEQLASYVEGSSPQSLSIEPGERLTVFLAPSGGYVLIQRFNLTRQTESRELKWQRKSSELFATPHTLKTLKLNVAETH